MDEGPFHDALVTQSKNETNQPIWTKSELSDVSAVIVYSVYDPDAPDDHGRRGLPFVIGYRLPAFCLSLLDARSADTSGPGFEGILSALGRGVDEVRLYANSRRPGVRHEHLASTSASQDIKSILVQTKLICDSAALESLMVVLGKARRQQARIEGADNLTGAGTDDDREPRTDKKPGRTKGMFNRAIKPNASGAPGGATVSFYERTSLFWLRVITGLVMSIFLVTTALLLALLEHSWRSR
jgi:hypothetical protein